MRFISSVVVLLVSVGAATLLGSVPAGAESVAKDRPIRVGKQGGDAGFWTAERIEQALANDLFDGRAEGVTAATSGSMAQSSPSLRHSSVPDPIRNRAIGKLILRLKGGFVGSCSGTLIDTPSRRLVITAAHCLYDYEGWVKSVRFLPGYDFGGGSFYSWGWKTMLVTPQWFRKVSTGRFPSEKFDIGTVVLAKRLGDYIEPMSYSRNPSRFGSTRIVGYPGGAMRGKRLRMCTTSTWKDTSSYSRLFWGPAPVIGRCDMARGSSGGPWLAESLAPDGSVEYAVKGVTSMGWKRPNRGRVLSSPWFGPALGELIQASEN